MARKPYTRRRLERLLDRLVALTETDTDRKSTVQQRQAFLRRARRLLSDLMKAEFSDVVVRDTVVRDLHAAVDAYVEGLVQSLRRTLRAQVGAEESGYLMLTHARLIARPQQGRGYRFEIDAGEIRTPNTFTVNVGVMLVLQVLRLLQFVGVTRLKICDCDRLFVQVGKRRFCSERCQTRVYMRRFRAGETDTGKE
jgi:hypothetical protein